MMLLMPIAFTVAIGHLAVANAWASIWVAPILGVLAARYVFGETLRPSSLVVAIVATLAAIIAHAPVVAPAADDSHLGFDGHGEDEAVVVVGVFADEINAAWRTDDAHAPTAAGGAAGAGGTEALLELLPDLGGLR